MIKNYNDYIPVKNNKYFTWHEFAILKMWGTYAKPTKVQYDNAIFLFTHLVPLRIKLNKPLIIASGARTLEYNRMLRTRGFRAALKSSHLDWRAVDLRCPTMTNRELWNFFNAYWPGSMENLVFTPGWTHLDTRNWGSRIRFNL